MTSKIYPTLKGFIPLRVRKFLRKILTQNIYILSICRFIRYPLRFMEHAITFDPHIGVLRKRLMREYGRIALPSIQLADLLGPGPYSLSHYTFAPWSAFPLEHVLVQELARRLRPCCFLEIGSLRGELLANLSPFVDSATSITLSKDLLLEFGYSKSCAETNMLFAGDIKNLKIIYADSTHYDFFLLGRTFNLIFIDGAHSHEAVKRDTKNVVGVCAEEFVIVWHDYLMIEGMTPNWNVFAGILDGLSQEMWGRLYHVNNTCCAVLLPETWNVHPYRDSFYPERLYSITMHPRDIDKSLYEN